jgi:hypothetical protein
VAKRSNQEKAASVALEPRKSLGANALVVYFFGCFPGHKKTWAKKVARQQAKKGISEPEKISVNGSHLDAHNNLLIFLRYPNHFL